jgi:hypothetical protein
VTACALFSRLPLKAGTIGRSNYRPCRYHRRIRNSTQIYSIGRFAAATIEQLARPGAAFAHNLVIGRQTWPVWPTLLLLAALLFPLDVAIRRLRLGRREWQQTRSWLRERLQGFRPAAQLERSPIPASPTVQAFRQAQQRVRSQPAPPPPAAASGAAPVKPSETASPASISPSSPSSSPADDQDTLARLRAAKKRARR